MSEDEFLPILKANTADIPSLLLVVGDSLAREASSSPGCFNIF
jgi:hypothetical protein